MARRLRSATIREGVIRTTTRRFLYALGLDDEDIVHPHIGVFHTGGEMSPCNVLLRDQALQAKTGIYAGGGTPLMREMLGITALNYGQGNGEKVALITDGRRFSGATRGLCIGYVSGQYADSLPGAGANRTKSWRLGVQIFGRPS